MGNRIEVNDGERYGLLTIIKETESRRTSSGDPIRQVHCRCDCGNTITRDFHRLRSGQITGCGCRKGKSRHGHAPKHSHRSPTYTTWANMKARCFNPKHPFYGNYGGRGITVCERWMKFENFLTDMGVRAGGQTIERIDNNKGYCKENCCWATRTQQSRNTRRTRMITFNRETHCLSEWAGIIGIASGTLRRRLRDWTFKEAMATPRLSQDTWRRP